jgi:hypothetical protein
MQLSVVSESFNSRKHDVPVDGTVSQLPHDISSYSYLPLTNWSMVQSTKFENKAGRNHNPLEKHAVSALGVLVQVRIPVMKARQG